MSDLSDKLLMEIRDEIREGEMSRLDYSNLRIANTPDSYFTKDNLRFVRSGGE